MSIKIIKKGKLKSNGREYIVIEMSGNTKAHEIVNRFGKNYYAGWSSTMKETRNGINYYTKVLYKREKPNPDYKNMTAIEQSFYL